MSEELKGLIDSPNFDLIVGAIQQLLMLKAKLTHLHILGIIEDTNIQTKGFVGSNVVYVKDAVNPTELSHDLKIKVLIQIMKSLGLPSRLLNF